MLLDEPTNHLDLDATLWLQRWLASYPGTLVMISHDRDFIDATCERVMRIEHQRLGLYKGGYSDFERQRAEHMAQQQASFDKQQRRIVEIDDFVRRFRYKATKAKQAQSRLKELERMQQLAPAHIDSPFQFKFPEPGKSSDPLLTLSEASVGYGCTTIVSNINMSLRPGDRIGLLGKNGAGKTTLLKSLTGALALESGERHEGAHLRVGYFDQQQLDVLDLEASALLHLQRLSPTVREQEILDFLGGFNFRGEMAKEPIAPFSGGEKARLALAMVVWQDPNLLVLDEPTNHLDLEMRHALEVALQGYSGALLLVSHDRHLLRNSVETLLLVDGGSVNEYDDDLAAYEQWILRGNSQANATVDESNTRESGQSRKVQRQEAADRRAKLKPLRQALQKAERDMDQAQAALAALQQSLSDPDLYQADRKEELAELVRQEGIAKSVLATREESWLELQEQLEHNEALLAS
jgi:ATP-binding cassette subfamily F protein 3